ncbi:unnamed protein product [Lactuca saligna]|uniref:Uncharacterized protein n=1 Tax=Lactuca saligna TaxID=75948 RepID=A0AA35V7P5_LACSI|nr:unnamed protein product [Lactuca saligna]
MYACVPNQSAIIQEYKKLPSSCPRELRPVMVRSIEEADKPSNRGKKQDKHSEGLVIKGSKGQTPKKRKTEQAAPSHPKKKKTKKPARRLILQSTSHSDSDYVPTGHKRPSPTVSERESSDEEVSIRGATPPHSPTPEVPVRSKAPSPPPASIPISLPTTFPLLSSSSANPYLEAILKALFSSAVKEHERFISKEAKAIDASTSRCQKASLAVETSTKECNEATTKFEKLISEAQLFLDSLQAAAQKNANTVGF